MNRFFNRLSAQNILAGIAFFAMLPLPYKFYLSIRVIIFLGGLYCLIRQSQQWDIKIIIGLLLIIVIYNPFMPIHLWKSLWLCINFTTGLFLIKMDEMNLSMNKHIKK